MPRARGMSGSPARTRSPATHWPIAPERRSSIGARRVRRGCPGQPHDEPITTQPSLDNLASAQTLPAAPAESNRRIEPMLNLNQPGLSLVLAAALSSAITIYAGSARAAEVKPEEIIVASTIPTTERDAELDAARAFYDFWNTDDAAFLNRAVADDFTDHTLPPGRPQGPQGPLFASHTFRAAVPDLKVTVHKMIVAGPM